jgi:ribosomal protein S14
MSFIKGRLRRLEERSRGGGRCQECGLPPDGPGYIVLIDEGRPEESFDGDPDERCGSCGRYVWCVIKVVYDDANEAEGGGGYRWP